MTKVTADMPDGTCKEAFELESPRKTMDLEDEKPVAVCMGFTMRQIGMLVLIPAIYAMMTLGAEYYTPLKPYFQENKKHPERSFMKVPHRKWTQVLSIHKVPKIAFAIPAGFVVANLSPSVCFISGLIGSAIALWMMWLDTKEGTKANLYLAGRVVDGTAKILMLNVSEATLLAWLTKAQRPTGKAAQAVGSSLANFGVGFLYEGIMKKIPQNLPKATAVAASIVTAAVFIVWTLTCFVNLSPPSYKSKIKMGLIETLTGYYRWVCTHPRHMLHLIFTWMTVCAFEIPWGSGKGELRTILGDIWSNSIPPQHWAKGPKGFQGLCSLALALTLKGTASFDTIYLAPVGAFFQGLGWALLYFRFGYKWNNRTPAVVLSQLCNVIGYSLQYIFVCPLVFNLTYLPYAPISIGISIMAGQGSQWLFQTFILGEAPMTANPTPEEYDYILRLFMVSCAVSFALSMTYIFVIKTCYSTEDEPIEDIVQDQNTEL